MAKSKTILPDTNTILRYLLKDHEEYYQKACILFERVRTGEESTQILESVLVECVYVLWKYYRVLRLEVANTLRQFLGYKGIVNKDKKQLDEALTVFGETSLDMVDCILDAKAKQPDVALFTFDQKLGSRSKKA